eukprot:jgi/Ulvmu1/1671/UM114_0045.1
MSGLVQRAVSAGKQVAAHPQVQGAVEQAVGVSRSVSQRYAELLRDNSKFVIGSSPAFYVTRDNLWKHAIFTTLADVPRVSRTCAKEASQWGEAIKHTMQHPGHAIAGDVGRTMLFTAELLALFKVGEFLGRGCTLFGYWP